MRKYLRLIVALTLVLPMAQAMAGNSPQEQRQALMEKSKDSAKTVGGMLRGKVPFDADTAKAKLEAWIEVSQSFGDLFPEGTETGYETEARWEIWSDRAGFDAKLAEFSEAVSAAASANPQTLDELKAVAQPVFKTCKGCHETYRVEKE